MKPQRGQILKVHKPKWTYTVKVRYVQTDDGDVYVSLTYADGTPMSDEDVRVFMIKQGWIQE